MNVQKFRKVLNILQNIIAIAVFTVLPIVAFTLISSKMELLGFRSFVVLTGSMSPLIPTGSIVFSQNSKSYRIGDIISFKKNDVTITHRIIDVLDSANKRISFLASPLGNSPKPTEVFYKTMGDANNVSDSELVPAKNVVGEAMFHFAYVGFLVMFLKSIPGFLIFVVLPTVLFIGFELWKIKGEIERNIEKKFLEKMHQTSS